MTAGARGATQTLRAGCVRRACVHHDRRSHPDQLVGHHGGEACCWSGLFHTASTITRYLFGELPGLGRRADRSFPVAATTRPQRHSGPTTPSTGRFPEVSCCVRCAARVTLAVMRCAPRDECNGASCP
jgi:hypothetical protein